jgi:hypothetical protein
MRSLPRLRGRVGERVSPQWDTPDMEKALTRRYVRHSQGFALGVLSRPRGRQGGLRLSRSDGALTEHREGLNTGEGVELVHALYAGER